MLTAALKLYGQNKTSEEPGHLIIKADCWHLFFYEQLRRLYPKTPFVIVYRSPDAVFHSHRKMPGLHTIPHLIEPALYGFEPGSPVFGNLDAYRAAVIEAYLKKAFKIAEAEDNILPVNYIDGPMVMIKKIASFAGISLSPRQLEIMEERSLYHSKNPGVRFSEEGVNSILPVLDGAMEAYKKLDEKRTAATTV